MTQKPLTGTLLDEHIDLSLNDLCRACSGSTEWVVELVEEGILEPIGHERAHWRFSGVSLQRAYTARRLQADLDVNIAGAALVLDLLDEIRSLRESLGRIEDSD